MPGRIDVRGGVGFAVSLDQHLVATVQPARLTFNRDMDNAKHGKGLGSAGVQGAPINRHAKTALKPAAEQDIFGGRQLRDNVKFLVDKSKASG